MLDLQSLTFGKLDDLLLEKCTPAGRHRMVSTGKLQHDENLHGSRPEGTLYFDIPTTFPTTQNENNENWYGIQY